MKGNKKLKAFEQAVIAYPEVTVYPLTNDIDFIISACDGVWDCVDVQKFCEEIYKRVKILKQPLNQVMTNLFDMMISKTKDCKLYYIFLLTCMYYLIALIGTDNMSCTIIFFKEKNINKTFTIGFELQPTTQISEKVVFNPRSSKDLINNLNQANFNIDNKSKSSLMDFYKLNKELCEIEFHNNNKEYKVLYDDYDDEFKEKQLGELNISKKTSEERLKKLCYENEFYHDKHKSL